uniref:Uncharacterized protein n=1 Tax=Helianthus annuus TaxID=4232 RepID=A0A251S263_HELAN
MVKLGQLRSNSVNTRRGHVLGTALRKHARLALHRNVNVTFFKLWNGWNRRTHEISST